MSPRARKRPRVDSTAESLRDDRAALIHVIRGFYRAAIWRTPVDEVPALVAAALEGGLCFGLLDPVSNIITNAVCHLPPPEGSSCLPAGVTVEEKTQIWVKEMAQRSLDALLAFLVCYFCHLPTSAALRYLREAKGDLLVAVQLVEMDRCTCAFDIGSPTARTALRCAALAAGRSPGDLVNSTLLFASQAGKISKILSSYPDRLSVAAIERLRTLLVQGNPECLNSGELIMFAASRILTGSDCPQFSIPKNIALRCTQSLQRVLLDRIHGFYLEALALLPRGELRRHYHRSIAEAGHMYGPFDPVSNIIVNTIWYCATFPCPEEQQFELDMVGRGALIRAERRSLAGLVSGLRAFVGGNLSDFDAIRHLLKANADLGVAMEALQLTCLKDQANGGHPPSTYTMPSELYRIMADAACHPSPVTLNEFLTSERAGSMLPTGTSRLSPNNVQRIISSFSQEPPSPGKSLELLPLMPLAARSSIIFSENKESFFADNSSFYRKVKAALDDYVHQTQGPELVIHVICGANEDVADSCGPEYSSIDWPRSHLKFHYSHFNFLASSAGSVPTLFFAECVNYDEESDRNRETFCCPVVVPTTNAEKVRCLYCEYSGSSIIHPVDKYYHGGDTDLENMVEGKHSFTNDSIFNHGIFVTDSMGIMEEDFVYFDPKRDHNLVKMVDAYVGVNAATV